MFICHFVLTIFSKVFLYFFFKMHHEFGTITEDRSIEGYKYRYSTLTMALAFFGTMFGYFGLIWAADSYRFFLPMVSVPVCIHVYVNLICNIRMYIYL